MYNILDIKPSCSEDIRASYFTVGLVSLSLISYSESAPSQYNKVIVVPEAHIPTKASKEVSEEELTRHAMRLSESSLKEDWDVEDDHWESFL